MGLFVIERNFLEDLDPDAVVAVDEIGPMADHFPPTTSRRRRKMPTTNTEKRA
jgi:hypothetical protein